MFRKCKNVMLILLFVMSVKSAQCLEMVIWDAQSFLGTKLGEVGCFTHLDEICAKLDVKRMNEVVMKVHAAGRESVDMNDTETLKRVFVALLHVDRFFTMEGLYESHYYKYDGQLCENFPEFEAAVQDKGNEYLNELESYYESKGGDVEKLMAEFMTEMQIM
jgi:hypothetical protein